MQVKTDFFFFNQTHFYKRFVFLTYRVVLCLGHQCACGSKHRTEWPQIMEVFSDNININEYPHILIGSECLGFHLLPSTFNRCGEDFSFEIS